MQANKGWINELLNEAGMSRLGEAFTTPGESLSRMKQVFHHSRWITLCMAFPYPAADSLDPMDHFLSFDVSLTIPKNMWNMIHALIGLKVTFLYVSPIVPPCSIVFFVHASIFLVHPLICWNLHICYFMHISSEKVVLEENPIGVSGHPPLPPQGRCMSRFIWKSYCPSM